MQPVLCANGDCPILFARGKASADVTETRASLALFDGW